MDGKVQTLQYVLCLDEYIWKVSTIVLPFCFKVTNAIFLISGIGFILFKRF